jgi:hypothetical protein
VAGLRRPVLLSQLNCRGIQQSERLKKAFRCAMDLV